MDEWTAALKEWYPEILSKKSYPLKISKHYTSGQRWEIYERLTKVQRDLINQHRRYLIQSQFLEENYLLATDWVFEDFRVNPFFRTNRRQEKLFCKCGRELKVQYIVKSEKTGERLMLGISHFAEHLHVSERVATSISQGMTTVDLAMDELLWLKQQNTPFPEELWQKYLYALLYNNRLKKPRKLNERLMLRVSEFRAADFPIYLADYKALEKEIAAIYQQTNVEKKTVDLTEVDFKNTKTSVEIDTKAFIETYQAFLQKDLSAIKTAECAHNKLPESFYRDLLVTLRKTKNQSRVNAEVTIQHFSQTAQGRWIQPQIYSIILENYLQYGLKEAFFYHIPRPIRNGLLRVLKREQAEKESTTTAEVSESKQRSEVSVWLMEKQQEQSLNKTQRKALTLIQQLEELRGTDQSIDYLLADYVKQTRESEDK
ncbi:hypothetical protein BAU15_03680 [Enterococcus sp. JM4C]|uniref:hypothetical protein n=1 Tax=Candidatus Enterococcus huntleyi TaxID=1857217 RepID=UPI0013798E70|nr:hypothetical protein [Enterococcus sp. JM4C]KAF1295652.1 hypothetical protein BAU15_03680 [Enterococcus sp. JM4C]